jgi:hypothetical protein
MEVLKITEHKDGSATIDLSITQEENMALVEYAIVHILKESIAAALEKAKKDE